MCAIGGGAGVVFGVKHRDPGRWVDATACRPKNHVEGSYYLLNYSCSQTVKKQLISKEIHVLFRTRIIFVSTMYWYKSILRGIGSAKRETGQRIFENIV